MTQAGILLGMNSFFALAGSTVGGALADRVGRRKIILFGLVFSALSSLSLGLANSIRLMYPLIVVVGLLASVANPAHEAMLADVLPESKRQEGYGILRVVFNYAWIVGTAMGGLIAMRSFVALFVIDAVISCSPRSSKSWRGNKSPFGKRSRAIASSFMTWHLWDLFCRGCWR
jgi:MFS family permease